MAAPQVGCFTGWLLFLLSSVQFFPFLNLQFFKNIFSFPFESIKIIYLKRNQKYEVKSFLKLQLGELSQHQIEKDFSLNRFSFE